MQLQTFLDQLQADPESIAFTDTIETIESHYDFIATRFSNGNQKNNISENQGSCKILAFAQLHKLSEAETLHCFGQYYREDVLQNSEGDNHQNIRQFMQHGFSGVSFEGQPLRRKS